MKVTCDRCHKEFNNVLKEKEKQIDGQYIIRTYLECPHCGEQYNVCYDSQSTLVLKKQIRRHTAMLGTIRDEHQYRRKLKDLKDIEKKQKRLEREMKILQTKYCKYFEEKEN